MTQKEHNDFLKMYNFLYSVSKIYLTSKQIKDASADGTRSTEFLSMHYDTIQKEADNVFRGIKDPNFGNVGEPEKDYTIRSQRKNIDMLETRQNAVVSFCNGSKQNKEWLNDILNQIIKLATINQY